MYGLTENKTEVFIDKNTEMDEQINLIMKDFDQLRENLLQIIIEQN